MTSTLQMDRLIFLLSLTAALFVISQARQEEKESKHLIRPTRWCVTSTAEELKCKQLKKVMAFAAKREVDALQKLFDAGKNETIVESVLPKDFQCVRTFDTFVCMQMIEDNEADLITLDSGLAYFAGRQHNLAPIMAENYKTSVSARPVYYSVAMVKAYETVTLENLRAKKICFPGIGTSAGWVYPIGRLVEMGHIGITQCNALVKAVSNYFQDVCLPGALTSFYNPLGNNPTSVCKLCTGQNDEFCQTSDTYGGYDGAFRCVAEGRGQVAFLRHDTISQMTGGINSSDTYRLFCPNGKLETVDNYLNCNWGTVSSNVIMTSAIRDPVFVESMKVFLREVDSLYGVSGTNKDEFELFTSEKSYNVDIFNQKLNRKNLMFNDNTKGFTEIGKYSYFDWVGSDFQPLLRKMNRCPSDPVRWCVTSMAEKVKCESMIMAFKAKQLQPDMDCMLGGNTSMCLKMIDRGDADLINLDAGDVYLAGKRYGLVPIAAEDYGDMQMEFKVVAVARKTDKRTTLFNMKGKRSCQPGIGRGDGWIIPLNIFIETEQFLPEDCSIFKNIGELFVRSCIPGALDSEYNPKGNPINLCEGCAAGGYRKCQRNSEEQYYGAAGAFRCLVEKGGDVSFVRHLTVRDNTGGRNHAIWARNRRSDDYEIMCKDGRRLNVDRFEECHLGRVPANAVVTSAGKTALQKEIMWNLLNYGQQFFSSDIDGDFHMFDSGNWYTDLLFTDAAVRLMKIPDDKQNYKAWLGESFLAQIENLQKYTCVNPNTSNSLVPNVLLSMFVAIVCSLFGRM